MTFKPYVLESEAAVDCVNDRAAGLVALPSHRNTHTSLKVHAFKVIGDNPSLTFGFEISEAVGQRCACLLSAACLDQELLLFLSSASVSPTHNPSA